MKLRNPDTRIGLQHTNSVKRKIATAAVSALALIPACSPDKSPETTSTSTTILEATRKAVITPSIAKELDTHSGDYAFAYGMGLGVGCEPQLKAEDGLPFADKARDFLAEHESPEVEAGYEAGIARGEVERALQGSDVCAVPPSVV
jgi:hypothetical protein